MARNLATVQGAIQSIKNVQKFSVDDEDDMLANYMSDLQVMQAVWARKIKETKRNGFSTEVNVQKCTERIGRLDKAKLKLQEENEAIEKLVTASRLKQEENHKRIEGITSETKQEHIHRK